MTLGDKTLHFQGKGTDLTVLQQKIEDYLKSDGFTVQTSAPSGQGTVLQAKKGGFLRGVVDADRALSILIWCENHHVGSAHAWARGVGCGAEPRSRRSPEACQAAGLSVTAWPRAASCRTSWRVRRSLSTFFS